MPLRFFALILAIVSISASRWTDDTHYRMFRGQLGKDLKSKKPDHESKDSPQYAAGTAAPLIALINKTQNAIETDLEQFRKKKGLIVKQNAQSTSAKKAEEQKKIDELSAALNESIQTDLDALAGKPVKVPCTIVDVVSYDTTKNPLNFPKEVTHVLIARARLITGISPEANAKIAETKDKKYLPSQEKDKQIKQIIADDKLTHCIGLYVLGTNDFTSLKVGTNITIDGNIRKIGMYYPTDYNSDSNLQFEVVIDSTAKNATTRPTTQEAE